MTQAETPFSIIWRQTAEADSDDIVDTIVKDSPAGAEKLGQELRNKVLPLAQHPRLDRASRPGLRKSVRELVVHRHYVIFIACRN